MRFLDLVKPVMFLLPEVSAPEKRVPFKEKLLWTSIALFIYLVCCQVCYVEMTCMQLFLDSLIRYSDEQECGSVLLDACYPCFEQVCSLWMSMRICLGVL